MTRIYEQLNTKTLGDVEAIDIQALQDKVHIQEINKQELETYNLINEAAMRNGLPIPGTGFIVTDSRAVDGNETALLFQPAVGEVWQLTGAATGTLTGARIELRLVAHTGGDVEIGAETASATQYDPFGSAPIYLDSNVYLNVFYIGGTGTMAVQVSMIRVR